MFDIGFLELLIIGVVGLLVLGPERLPKAVRTTGLWVGRAKRTVANMQREISAQLEAEELRQKLDEQQQKLDAGLDQVRKDVERYAEPPERRDDSPSPPAGTVASDASSHTETRSQQAAHEPVAPATAPSDARASDDQDATPR